MVFLTNKTHTIEIYLELTTEKNHAMENHTMEIHVKRGLNVVVQSVLGCSIREMTILGLGF